MTERIAPHPIEKGPRRRHQATVGRFSADVDLLDRLDALAVHEADAREIVGHVCDAIGVEAPILRFHARRSPYTGATEHPRWLLVSEFGESEVLRVERHRRKTLPIFGAMRLGRTTTLMTIAHELGHHLVFALEPRATPPHGKVWVRRFDEAARIISHVVDRVFVPAASDDRVP
ncbi:MAG: hypothetical protein ABFR53_13575 [Actinomycetota bacterium]